MPEQASNQPKIHEWIARHAPEGGRVLDIGCGGGELLGLLVERRGVRGTGIELDEAKVIKAVQRGLSVHHGDVEEGLDHYSNGSFDLVILSFTIEELGSPKRVLHETFRVGRQVVVVFPNFSHWRARIQLGISGRAPRTASLPHTWYDSPNRHFFTVADWEEFCREEGWQILDRGYLSGGRPIRFLPNLRAEVACYLLQSPTPPRG